MARPREFDEEQVLARARDAFWSRGVEATSISDLSVATGLSVGSIYKAFGSKAELCHRSLDHYAAGGRAAVSSLLEQGATPLAGLEIYLQAMAAQASDESPTRGCFAVNCATELAENDPEVRELLRRSDAIVVTLLADAVRAAIAAGEVRDDVDPVDAARFLYTTVNGLQVEARKGITGERAAATATMAVRALR